MPVASASAWLAKNARLLCGHRLQLYRYAESMGAYVLLLEDCARALERADGVHFLRRVQRAQNTHPAEHYTAGLERRVRVVVKCAQHGEGVGLTDLLGVVHAHDKPPRL